MSSINQKLGLKAAGKRRQMNLPKSRSDAAAMTSRQCPHCGHAWVIQNAIRGVTKRMCAWCSADLTGGGVDAV